MQSKTRSKRSPHRHVSRRQREKPMFTMTLRTSLQTCTRQSRWLIASSLRGNSSSDIPSSLQRSEIWLTQSCVSLPVTLGIHRCEQVAMAGWRPVGPFKAQGRRNRHLAEPVARQGRPVSLPPSWSCGRECPWLSPEGRRHWLCTRLQERVVTRHLPTRCGQQGELHGLFGALLSPARLQDAFQPLQGCGRAPDWGEGE